MHSPRFCSGHTVPRHSLTDPRADAGAAEAFTWSADCGGADPPHEDASTRWGQPAHGAGGQRPHAARAASSGTGIGGDPVNASAAAAGAPDARRLEAMDARWASAGLIRSARGDARQQGNRDPDEWWSPGRSDIATAGRFVAGVRTQGLLVAGAGVAVGLAAAAGLTQLMSSLLFGVTALDPLTYRSFRRCCSSSRLWPAIFPHAARW